MKHGPRTSFGAIHWWMVVAAVSLTLSAGVAVHGQEPQSTLPRLIPESLVGSVSFDLYCASCHGRSGKGDGPVGPTLWTPPADLTTLSRRNRGAFPRARVLSYIDGSTRLEAIHGRPDMPVWGATLRALDASDARGTVRLENLVAFIESIQAGPDGGAPTALEPNGAVLFRTFCAGCHGPSGRGDGAMAIHLRRPPPDLTRFAARNGGVFPSERVSQIIAGRGPAAHGDRDMPVWGYLFTYANGGSPDPATARIRALVEYLAAIQERPAE